VAQENIEMIEFLFKHGADPNVQDNEGWTPLHAVCQYGFTDVAKLLLKHGADPGIPNVDNELPVDLIDDNEEMNELLLSDFSSSYPSPSLPFS